MREEAEQKKYCIRTAFEIACELMNFMKYTKRLLNKKLLINPSISLFFTLLLYCSFKQQHHTFGETKLTKWDWYMCKWSNYTKTVVQRRSIKKTDLKNFWEASAMQSLVKLIFNEMNLEEKLFLLSFYKLLDGCLSSNRLPLLFQLSIIFEFLRITYWILKYSQFLFL